MTLDQATRRNLELTQTIRGNNKKGSLLGVLDATRTPMGSRLLRRWLHQPLLDLDKLTARLDAVQSWHDDLPARAELRTLLRQIGDLERWTNRAAQGIARPQDMVGIRQALELLPDIERLQNLRKLTIDNCQLINCQLFGCPSSPASCHCRGAAGHAGKRRCNPQGLFSRTGRHRRRRARCQGMGRQPGAQRTRAHRHQVAQGRLQQGLRLLHRDHHGQQSARARQLHPQADPGQCRALHHPRVEGIREPDPECRGAAARAGDRDLPAGVGSGRRGRAALVAVGPGPGRVGRDRISGRGGGQQPLRSPRAGRRPA